MAVQLRVVRCCNTCSHSRGWPDNMWCGLHKELEQWCAIRPHTICNDYTPQKEYSDELQHQPMDDQRAKGLSGQD